MAEHTIKSVLVPVEDKIGNEWQLLARKGRTQLRFEDGHMVIGYGSLRALRSYRTPTGSRMPRDGYDVLFWLYENLRQCNTVAGFRQAQIARDLGVDRSRIAHMFAHLERANCIQRIGPRCVRLNPLHCFWGNRSQQEDAVAEWNRNRLELLHIPAAG